MAEQTVLERLEKLEKLAARALELLEQHPLGRSLLRKLEHES